MPKGPQELGTKSPFKLRVGIDIPTWRGVNKEGDPGAIQPDEFQDAINIRILPSGRAVCRGGQEKVNPTPFSGCVMGIFDDEVPATPTRWWFGGQDSFDPEAGVVYPLSVDAVWVCATTYGDELIVLCTDNKIYSFDGVTETRTLVHDFAVAYPNQGIGMAVAGSTLYVCFCNQATDEAYVHTWNGTIATLDHTFTGMASVGAIGPILASYGGEPYLTYHCVQGVSLPDTPNEIWRRQAGVWTSLVMPGTVANFSCRDWLVFGGALYLAGYQGPGTLAGTHSGVILKYNGATVTLARQIGNDALDQYAVDGITQIGSVLAYVYHQTTNPSYGTGLCFVGTYDGSSWVDQAKDVKTQFGYYYDAASQGNYPHVTFVHNGYLFIIGAFYGIDATFLDTIGYSIIKSPSGFVSGTWTFEKRIFIGGVGANVDSQVKGYA